MENQKNSREVSVIYFTICAIIIFGFIITIYLNSVMPVMLSVLLSWFYYRKRKNILGKNNFEVINTSNIKEAESYIENIKEKKSLPLVNSSVFLNSGEHVFLEEQSQLMETRSIRQTRGRGGRVRIWKGLSVGQWASQSESHKEWRVLDTGKITLTNKRIIFDGPKENRVIQLNKIIGVDTLMDAIEISQETRQNSTMFVLRNPYIWTAVLKIIKAVPDPLRLENIDLNLNFK